MTTTEERLAAFRKAVADFAADLAGNWTLDEGVRSAAVRLQDDLDAAE